MPELRDTLLEMRGIEKSFPGVKALDGASLNVYPGEVMALMGENGAGKSTLIKVMAGILLRDSGSVLHKGREVSYRSARESQDAGIAVIHQELNLVPQLSVAENIFLGREFTSRSGRIDWPRMNGTAQGLLSSLEMTADPETPVKELSIGKRQMVEIAKALSQNAEMIVMDEPTGTLTDSETQCLFKVIRDLKAMGKGIVYISHRLKEIPQVCDRVTIMRDGRFIAEESIRNADEEFIIEKMVGRALSEQFPRRKVDIGGDVLKVCNMNGIHAKNVSFSVKKGEVLGVAGLMGSGRTEIIQTLYGHFPKVSGEIFVKGKLKEISSPSDAIKQGIAYVSEDRKGSGLVLDMNVRENMTLASLKLFSSWGHINSRRERESVDGYVQAFRIKTPSQEQIIKNLSGGNQQKVAIAKALLAQPDILILDEPTRGIDVGAKKEIYDVINDLKEKGLSIIIISSEMPELIGLSDRIIVVRDRALAGEVAKDEFDQERILQLAIGA